MILSINEAFRTFISPKISITTNLYDCTTFLSKKNKVFLYKVSIFIISNVYTMDHYTYDIIISCNIIYFSMPYQTLHNILMLSSYTIRSQS